jgi:hypothetical protein
MAAEKNTALSTKPPTTDVYMGVVFELNGEDIALEPKNAINELKTKGLECGLPPGKRVELGTVGAGLRGIFEDLGATPPEFLKADGTIDETQIPDIDFLKRTVTLLTQADLAVEQFHVKIPGTLSKDTNNYYTIGMSATWSADAGTLSDTIKLKLKGIYFKVSNEGG